LEAAEQIVVAASGDMENCAKEERSSAETDRNGAHSSRCDYLLVGRANKVLPRRIGIVDGEELAVAGDLRRSARGCSLRICRQFKMTVSTSVPNTGEEVSTVCVKT
jgi:hypothetical protein